MPPTAPRTSRFRGFTEILAGVSLLAAAATLRLSPTVAMSIAISTLAVITCVAAWGRTFRCAPWRRWSIVLLAGCVAGTWAIHVDRAAAPIPWGAFQTAVAAAYAALAVAAMLVHLRITDDAHALLVTLSIAVPLVLLDAFVQELPIAGRDAMAVEAMSDPLVGWRVVPYSTGASFYPDNPRNYFEKVNPLDASWRLATPEGSAARLDRSEALKVSIEKDPAREGWHVQLSQSPFAVAAGRHVLRFKGRTDRPRKMGVVLTQDHSPWQTLSAYQAVDLDGQWRPVVLPVDVTQDDEKAKISFDLNGAGATFELSGVVLHDAAAARDLTPNTKALHYSVGYRFNALGFRGPDYAIPRPPNVFRILALGDSYTMGAGVHEADTFPVQLERRLNRRAAAHANGLRYEVINAGVSGYDTRQERVSYELFASAYKPQLVLLVGVFNDDLSFQEEAEWGLLPTPLDAKLGGRVLSVVNGLRSLRRTYDYSGTIREIHALAEACRQRDARLVFVIFRNGSLRIGPWGQLVAAAREGLADTDVPWRDLGEALLGGEHSAASLWVHRTDGHPNEIAHRLAAEEIERFLRSVPVLPE